MRRQENPIDSDSNKNTIPMDTANPGGKRSVPGKLKDTDEIN